MFEQQQQESTTFKTGFVIVLIALAVPIGVWVLITVNNIINAPVSPAIIEKIIPDTGGGVVAITTPAGRIELPKQIFTVTAYMVLFLFLLIPTKIAIALLTGGISLLKPDISKQMHKFLESLSKQPAKQ